MRFPAKENAGWSLVAQKHRAFSRQEKMASSPPVGLPGDSPPPPLESARADRRTLTSELKFLGSIGYQMSLFMVIRSAAFGRKGAPLLSKFCALNFYTFVSVLHVSHLRLCLSIYPHLCNARRKIICDTNVIPNVWRDI